MAEAVEILGLRYAVITSVTRDDLADGGAALFAETIRAVRRRRPETLRITSYNVCYTKLLRMKASSAARVRPSRMRLV